MAYATNLASLQRLLCRRRLPITSFPAQFSSHVYGSSLASSPVFLLFLYPTFCDKRRLSTSAEWTAPSEFAGMNAYDILGVSRASSFAEIKAAFRKLAKETHPDLAHSQNHSSHASSKFIQILAAYELIYSWNFSSVAQKVIFSQTLPRGLIMIGILYLKEPSLRDTLNKIQSSSTITPMDTRLSRWKCGMVEMHTMDLRLSLWISFPNCFEAEERSTHTTSEVLHLVSGRDLFGMVCLANKYHELSHGYTGKLTSSTLKPAQLAYNSGAQPKSDVAEGNDFQKQSISTDYQSSDAYSDLELHLCGRVVAVATRVPAISLNRTEDEAAEDIIHVYLTSCEEPGHLCPEDRSTDSPIGSRIPLGIIKGLGTTSEEGTCYVYNNSGMKTHMIMKHRTMLVKHLHWFRVGKEVSVCECRCSRARLPPSKFWLFEPRSAMHDIGGWYVETFGRDNKGKTVPAQRYWDGLDTNQHFEERLHPAIYLLALAYRTLDIEDLRRGKRTIKDRVEAKMSKGVQLVQESFLVYE
ncbi:UNVERIFIED_CONTAM: Chaperone protein DnaJ [Sesamum calycinum]|uniref:Chaperone protein DnaJ n=1 Tax=Sesamum calycinum TaxID=2727403 RepID=A0AAW2MNC8_9LAMI